MIGYILLIVLQLNALHSLYGTIHDDITTITDNINKIERSLKNPFNEKQHALATIKKIEQQITKIENYLPSSPEQNNPFLPAMISDIKNRLNNLTNLYKAASIHSQQHTQKLLSSEELLDQWNKYNKTTLNYFLPYDNPFESKDLFTRERHKKNTDEKELAKFCTQAIEALKHNLENLQNSLFDVSLNFQEQCDKEFTKIRNTIYSIPPAIPKRESSLKKITKETGAQNKNEQPAEKSFLDVAQEKVSQHIKKAQQFASKHIPSIEQALQQTINPQKEELKKIISSNPNNPLKIRLICDDLYNAKFTYKTVQKYAFEDDMLHRLMNFIELHTMPLFNIHKTHLTKMADNSTSIIQKLITSLIKSQKKVAEKSIFEGELYYALFVLPNLFYDMLILNRLSWISEKANLLANKIHIYLEKHIQTPYKENRFSPQSITEIISHAKTTVEKVNSLQLQDLLNAHFFLYATTTLIPSDNHDIISLHELLNTKMIAHIHNTKNTILTFMHTSLLPTIESPFPPSISFYNSLFKMFSSFKNIEVLSLLYKPQKDRELSKAVYQETVLAKQAIYNGFNVCAKKAKVKADENRSARTVWTVLYEQINRIMLLLKPTIEKQAFKEI